MSAGAISTVSRTTRAQQPAPRELLAHDLFKTWGKITRSGPHGLIVVDPPSYQKGSFVAGKDYVVDAPLPELLIPGGRALICLNAPEFRT